MGVGVQRELLYCYGCGLGGKRRRERESEGLGMGGCLRAGFCSAGLRGGERGAPGVESTDAFDTLIL